MAGGNDPEVARFLRVADDRLTDAEVLFAGQRTTAALYLGGYAAECALKAVLLVNTPRSQYAKLLESFRGHAGHDLERLRRTLSQLGVSPPRRLRMAFIRLGSWTTDVRYRPGQIRPTTARAVRDAALDVLHWVRECV